MKKKMIFVSLIGAMTMLMAACGSSTETGDTTGDTEKVQITYANWNLGTESDLNLERLMIEAFNKTHDHIEVVIDQSIDGEDYNGKMNTAASAGNLPDVFMINDIPTSYRNEWLLDITELAAADEDFASLDEIFKENSKVGEQTMAIPFAKHMLGYYVNKDLLDSMNLDAATSESTVEDFVSSVKNSTDVNNQVVGVQGAQSIFDWYPGAVNADYGWFTFGEDSFHLDSPEMIEAVNIAKDLVTNGYSYDDLSDEQKESMSGNDSGLAFLSNQIVYYYNGTYMNAYFQREADFNFEFIGLPGGRQAVTGDFLGISKSTEHPEAAYEFAKYMSFGKEGFLKRIELAESEGLELATLPLTTNSEVLDAYWEIITVPGVQEANAQLEGAMFEPIKVVPGYIQARFEAPTGLKIGDEENAKMADVFNAATKGTINYQDYASQLQELAQKQYEDAQASMNN